MKAKERRKYENLGYMAASVASGLILVAALTVSRHKPHQSASIFTGTFVSGYHHDGTYTFELKTESGTTKAFDIQEKNAETLESKVANCRNPVTAITTFVSSDMGPETYKLKSIQIGSKTYTIE